MNNATTPPDPLPGERLRAFIDHLHLKWFMYQKQQTRYFNPPTAAEMAFDERCSERENKLIDAMLSDLDQLAALLAGPSPEETPQKKEQGDQSRMDSQCHPTPSRTAPPVAPISTAGADDGLTFNRFSAINRQRCESPDGFSHPLNGWSTSDWFTAVLGELGEAANLAKKLNRYRDGIPGNKESEDVLRDKLRKELGDTFVYLDLLCQAVGVSIGAAAVEVFNAKSDELGCPIRIEQSALLSVGPPQE